MFLWWDLNNLGHFCKVSVLRGKFLCPLLNFGLVVIFEFSIKKHLLVTPFFCVCFFLKDYSFHCVACNLYPVGHTLIVRVRRGTDIYHLISYDLGIFQFLLDVQSLAKHEHLPIFDLCLCLWLILII